MNITNALMGVGEEENMPVISFFNASSLVEGCYFMNGFVFFCSQIIHWVMRLVFVAFTIIKKKKNVVNLVWI